ncbi:MAG TPA: hypothetical protein VF550_20280 [Polyangia bacterium]
MRRYRQRSRSPRWLTRKPWVVVSVAVLAVSITGWAASKKAMKETAMPATQAGKAGDDDAPPVKSDTVHITIQTVPPRKAQVKWGRKSLGLIPAPRPLVVERPRDSGPLDLAIRASGFLPVHTRAYTFTDSRVAVKLTPPLEKSKLFGYREEPTPNPDAGVPGVPAGAPTAPAPGAPGAPVPGAPGAIPEPPKP